jgi:hypothetical protein
MAEGLPGEGEADAERAGGGLHHRGAGQQFTAFAGAEQHGHRGPRLHPARRERLQLGPEPGVPAGQLGGDAYHGRTAEEREEFAARVGEDCGRGHRAAPGRP